MPNVILPNAVYSRDELKQIGYASVDLLRVHGLIGGPVGGYLGSNVLEAMAAYIRSRQECKASTRRRSAGGERCQAAAIPIRPQSKSQADQFKERTGTR